MKTPSLLVVTCGTLLLANEAAAQQGPSYIGQRNRFWKHHVEQETLVIDGEEHYQNIQSCLQESLTEEERHEIETAKGASTRKVVQTIAEPTDEDRVFLVHLEKALLPIHVKAIQTLASCVRKFIPSMYESRAMYQEMAFEKDPGLGGNCPTHIAPLVSIFLPAVVKEMNQVLELAYSAGGWEKQVQEDRDNNVPRKLALMPPKDAGFRASEHLTYADFPTLASHTDGDSTMYTMNYAFGGAEEYDGGEFYIVSKMNPERKRFYLKPKKYDALVFLGGRYHHGVTEITGGNREMFSSEWWPYPDTPVGSTLWTNNADNMEDYITRCNWERKDRGDDYDGPCTVEKSTKTSAGLEYNDMREKYGVEDGPRMKTAGQQDLYQPPQQQQNHGQQDPMHDYYRQQYEAYMKAYYEGEGIQQGQEPVLRARNNRPRDNKAIPSPLTPTRFVDGNGKEFDMADFRPKDVEPDFLIPAKLEPGEMVPIRWRDTLSPIDGDEGETYVVGFPDELVQAFQDFAKDSGLMKVAREILYKEKSLVPREHRLYTLDDGMKWGAMIQGQWNTDMVWLDPADEASFENILSVLRRGNFDVVLDSVAKAFDLDGLMIQGVGAIFLTEYELSQNNHVDIEGSRGSFYNIILPVHIPINESAKFYVSEWDENNNGYKGSVDLSPNVGVVLGGESTHGTGECNYQSTEEFRLSFAVYVADISDENLDLIASDSTSLWPTSGDTHWFRAQQGRLWKRDGTTSLKNDKGRQPMNVEDKDATCPEKKHLCEVDTTGVRLRCPKTCELYLEDSIYYSRFFSESDGAAPTCAQADVDCQPES